jgi:hypothetical protein
MFRMLLRSPKYIFSNIRSSFIGIRLGAYMALLVPIKNYQNEATYNQSIEDRFVYRKIIEQLTKENEEKVKN